jgi:peptidyl-prolyl isomerase D
MDIVRAIEANPTHPGDKPILEVKIVDCGALAPGEPDGVQVDATDPYPFMPEEYEEDKGAPDTAAKVVIAEQIRTLGNELFKAGKYKEADQKYRKALNWCSAGDFPSPAEQELANKASTPCYLNAAACCLKLNNPAQVHCFSTTLNTNVLQMTNVLCPSFFFLLSFSVIIWLH